jgi:hypothetical protein
LEKIVGKIRKYLKNSCVMLDLYYFIFIYFLILPVSSKPSEVSGREKRTGQGEISRKSSLQTSFPSFFLN